MGSVLVRRMEGRNLSCGFGGQGHIEGDSRSYCGGGVGAETRQEGLGGGIRILFSFMEVRET